MNRPTSTTHDQSMGLFRRAGVRYEVACDVIGAVIAHFAELIGTERDRPSPDTQKIAHAQQLVTELKNIREDLDPTDSAAIEATIARLAPLARHLYQDAQEGSREARRAAQFVEAKHPLPLKACSLQSTIWPFRHRSSWARSATTKPWLGISAAPHHEQRHHHVPSRARCRQPDAGRTHRRSRHGGGRHRLDVRPRHGFQPLAGGKTWATRAPGLRRLVPAFRGWRLHGRRAATP